MAGRCVLAARSGTRAAARIRTAFGAWRGVAVELLTKVTADGKEVHDWRMFTPEPKDRLAAIKALADIGMGASVTMADVRERLRQQVDVIRQTLPTEQAEQLLDALKAVWK